ncbi:MAG: Flp family type IVb pilin [Caulobacter sp.]|nr:Flp family type IVb pilin [Caulobacter sp.]
MASRSALKAFWSDESGATAVELGVLVALITLALVTAMNVLSGGMKTSFSKTSAALNAT